MLIYTIYGGLDVYTNVEIVIRIYLYKWQIITLEREASGSLNL